MPKVLAGVESAGMTFVADLGAKVNEIISVINFGARNTETDPLFDNTDAFTNAITYATRNHFEIVGAGQGTTAILVPSGTWRIGKMPVIMGRSIAFVGAGQDDTVLDWISEGNEDDPLAGMFEVGVRNLNPTDIYDSAGTQGLTVANMTLRRGEGLTGADNFGTSGNRKIIGIRDNGCGNICTYSLSILGFKYGRAYTFGSDFDRSTDVVTRFCDVGLYMGPASQQFLFLNDIVTECPEARVLDSTTQGSFQGGHSGDNGADFVFECSQGTATRLGASGSALESARTYNLQVSIQNMWFETGAGPETKPYDNTSHIRYSVLGSQVFEITGIEIFKPRIVSGTAGYPVKDPSKTYSFIDANRLSVRLLDPVIDNYRLDVLFGNTDSTAFPNLWLRNPMVIGLPFAMFSQPNKYFVYFEPNIGFAKGDNFNGSIGDFRLITSDRAGALAWLQTDGQAQAYGKPVVVRQVTNNGGNGDTVQATIQLPYLGKYRFSVFAANGDQNNCRSETWLVHWMGGSLNTVLESSHLSEDVVCPSSGSTMAASIVAVANATTHSVTFTAQQSVSSFMRMAVEGVIEAAFDQLA